jgi:hypothetical protein
VVAIGEGPTSWADYFNQQKRWAYGIWEILLTRSKRMPRELSARQRLLYGLVQFYYPSVASSTLFGNLATALYLLTGVTAIELNGGTWVALWSASMASWFILWFWLRRFNIAAHEREEVGVPGMALALFAGPVYVSAAIAAVFRRPLAYAVTAKGKLRTTESIATFRLHLMWATVAAGLLVVSRLLHHDYVALQVWCCLTLVTGISPPLIAALSAVAAKVRRAMAARTEPGGAAGAPGVPPARGVSADATPTMVFKGGLVPPDMASTLVLNGGIMHSDATATMVMSTDVTSTDVMSTDASSAVPIAPAWARSEQAPRRAREVNVVPPRAPSRRGTPAKPELPDSIAPVRKRRAKADAGERARSARDGDLRGAVERPWRPTLVTPANGHGATYRSADGNPQPRSEATDAIDPVGG